MGQNFRQLYESELATLVSNGCRAENWNDVTVSDDFRAGGIHNCTFAGKVEIEGGVTIRNIGSVISRCRICNGALIENVGRIENSPQSSFGNGVRVKTINEGGGREVVLYDRLTAQIAYIMAIYRQRTASIKRLEEIIDKNIEDQRLPLAVIGRGAKITDCGTIKDVNIGECATLDGVSLLENGTVGSSLSAPTLIGHGVIMRDFVTSSGCEVVDGALLRRCFVGEGVHLASFTATDSLFFANSVCENGEACSIFAGPYTVSHHKSTLLIAGMFSFFNAGSGTNQSNHLFKTGAVHQGIHQRGCKYGSNAYMMLPAVDGAFTVVLGSHKNHPDTELFPYSYLIEQEGASYLIPAYNLCSYGTVRDIAKWPVRDVRKGEKLDLINFDESNPYICERVINGIEILRQLSQRKEDGVHSYGRMKIKSSAVMHGIRLYELAKSKFLGQMLSGISSTVVDGSGHWVDAAGMFLPRKVMDSVLDDLDSGVIDSIRQLEVRLSDIHANYTDYARSWAHEVISTELGHDATKEDIEMVVKDGLTASEKLKSMTDADRLKDSDKLMRLSYGIDEQTDEAKDRDFKAVRGE